MQLTKRECTGGIKALAFIIWIIGEGNIISTLKYRAMNAGQ